MAKETGMKYKLYVLQSNTEKVIGGQRSTTINRSAESIDATSKDTEGYWKESLAGFKEWSIDTDIVLVDSDEAVSILEEAFLNSENVDVILKSTVTGAGFRGNASITDLSMEYPYDDVVTASLSLQGNGALEKIRDTREMP